ncbi:hypothetical protein DAEQUDRAFT_750464 [Daedalea quercina L-15889]|uniref:Hypervirulence associated protein TUDOR domain-containing protein n=1 Tax=Daedalea quercina L-15889 TaxID=1314783 RepID=A0A165R5X6_9APHY|nr:hypothetical protein DAEQUDRAFT_750464 [Daedalea quercina L-15889]
MSSEEILPGDIVAVNHGGVKREGLVVGSSVDYAGRQMIEVQLDPTEPTFQAWYPTVTRVKRTISYTRPTLPQRRSVERYIYW